jgi:hypothetical protein
MIPAISGVGDRLLQLPCEGLPALLMREELAFPALEHRAAHYIKRTLCNLRPGCAPLAKPVDA